MVGTLNSTLNRGCAIAGASKLNVLTSNLCKYFESQGYSYLDLPLVVNNTIRRDLTSAMALTAASGPSSLYKHGVVLRPERHCDLGKRRQFVQFDFDVLGLCSMVEDVSLVLNTYKLVNAMGCASYVKCLLNSKRVLLGLSEVLGLLCYSFKKAKLMSVLDKSLGLSLDDVVKLLSAGRFDVSGDFVPGLGLNASEVEERLWGCFSSPANHGHDSNFRTNSVFLVVLGSFLGEFGVRELLYFDNVLVACGLLDRFVVLKPLFCRGLEYYTGAVLEVVSSVVLMSDRNVFVKIGSLFGGGRFDNLVNANYAVGCSLGITRFLEFVNSVKRSFGATKFGTWVCVCFCSRDCFDSAWLACLHLLSKLKVSWKLCVSSNFALALKLASRSAVLVFCASGGWILKLVLKRNYLRDRISNPILWRRLFIDQFWASGDCLFDGLNKAMAALACYGLC
ncbi:hypothetical protein AAHH88_00040 [Candidatus Hodgkinia cicadicola]